MKEIIEKIFLSEQQVQDLNSYIRVYLSKLTNPYYIYEFSGGKRYIEIDRNGDVWYWSISKKRLIQLPPKYLLSIAQAINTKSPQATPLNDVQKQEYLKLRNRRT